MIRRPPRSTRLTHSFPTRRSSDLANAPLWGKEVYPKLSNALAADKLKHDVHIVSAAFTGTSNNFPEVMRQNTATNAFMQARNSMSGGTGAAEIDTFAQTRADIQARKPYKDRKSTRLNSSDTR